jgi:hypothetical protein
MTLTSSSLFDRVFSRKRPAWVVALVSLLLLLLPFMVAYLDGELDYILRQGFWRVLVLPPAIILYIWLVSPLISRSGTDVIRALQPYTALDAESYASVVKSASTIRPLHEVVILCVGIILGILSALASGFNQQAPLVKLYWLVFASLMNAILLWTIFISIASTRVNATLHRHLTRIDLFDQTPFTVVGRQSLLLALVFVGGMTISMLLSIRVENLTSPSAWLGSLIMILVTGLIFFMSMYPTHNILAQVKKTELASVRKRIQDVCRELVHRIDENQLLGELPTQVNTLAFYEQRLLVVRTWPYNTSMLRTLFLSVSVPLITMLGRRLAETIFVNLP